MNSKPLLVEHFFLHKVEALTSFEAKSVGPLSCRQVVDVKVYRGPEGLGDLGKAAEELLQKAGWNDPLGFRAWALRFGLESLRWEKGSALKLEREQAQTFCSAASCARHPAQHFSSAGGDSSGGPARSH